MVVIKLYFKSIDLRLLPNIPGKKSDAFAEPADIILSLVETTLLDSEFLSGNPWPKGKALESSQRGIAFSTISDHDSSGSHPKSYMRSWGSLL